MITNIKNMKLETKPFSEFVGKTLEDLQKHLKETKASVAGLPELEYIMSNPDEFPELKDGKWFYFFGAGYLRYSNGDWDVPAVSWHGSALSRDALWLGGGWDANDRVLLVRLESGSDYSLTPGGNGPLIAATAIKKGEQVEVREGKVFKIKLCESCGQRVK